MGELEFLLKSFEIKEIKRKGWLRKVGIENPESVASHSFGIALLALVFLDDPELFRLLKMAIIHDLAEVIIGDLTPEEKREDHAKLKLEAFKHLISPLSEEKRRKLLEVFEEASRDELFKELDKLDMAIQALYYKLKGYPKEKLYEFTKINLKNPTLRKIHEEVIERFSS